MGADVTTTNQQGTTLLMLAAKNHDIAQIDFLLEKGLLPEAKRKDGKNAVHLTLISAIWSNDPFNELEPEGSLIVSILKKLHSKGASLTQADNEGITPLHLAAASRISDPATFLLSFYDDPLPLDKDGWSPLHTAASTGSTVVIKLLIPHSKNVDQSDSTGQTALMLAASGDRLESARRLLKAGANINAKDYSKTTALASAILENRIPTARFLLDNGATIPDLELSELLITTARLFHDAHITPDDFGFLIAHISGLIAETDVRDAQGVPALHWIASSDNSSALNAFLKRSPDINSQSPDGRTALMWAVVSHAEKTARLLIAAGADPDIKDNEGKTAADWGKWPEAEPIISDNSPKNFTRKKEAALSAYLKKGDWKLEDRIGAYTPLHLAAALGNQDAVEKILKLGAPVDQLLYDRSTPLMEAAANGRTHIMEIFLAKGADFSLKNGSGSRAIDLAVSMNHPDVARLLLARDGAIGKNETGLLYSLVGLGDAILLRDFLKAGASISPKGIKSDDPYLSGRKIQRDAPAIFAAGLKTPEILRVLAEFPSASALDEPEVLSSALHKAAENGRLQNVRYLIDFLQADLNLQTDDSMGGMTRIDTKKNPKLVAGFTPLSRALEQDHEKIVRYLIEKKAIITGRTRSGSPPLNFVAEKGDHNLMKLFLKHDAATDFVDFDGKTALHISAEKNDDIAVGLLLSHGGDKTATSNKGETPLDLASKADAEKTISLLEKSK
jgi:hypothetical protein